jgi:hypothetical protein
MINSALDPNWKGYLSRLEEKIPHYDNKVFHIRRKIFTGRMGIVRDYWIDIDRNLPPVHFYKTYTHLIHLWRTPGPTEIMLPNKYVESYRTGHFTGQPDAPTVPELYSQPALRTYRKRKLQ